MLVYKLASFDSRVFCILKSEIFPTAFFERTCVFFFSCFYFYCRVDSRPKYTEFRDFKIE